MLHLRPLETAGRAQERHAAQALVAELFGPDVVLMRDPHGRPFLTGIAGLHISISHTQAWLGLLVSDRPCGLDIEAANRRTAHLADRFATPGELALAGGCFPQNPALLVWCAKEALYKRQGRQGVDFLHDLHLIAGDGSTLTAQAHEQTVSLGFELRDGLLVVRTSD